MRKLRPGGSQEGPIRYGEGFRLRAAGTKALYLGADGRAPILLYIVGFLVGMRICPFPEHLHILNLRVFEHKLFGISYHVFLEMQQNPIVEVIIHTTKIATFQ